MFQFFRDSIDYRTLGLSLVLGAIGITAVNSATFNSGMHAFFTRDIVWQAGGLVVALAIMFSANRFLENGAYFYYAITILLLLFVLVAGKRVATHTSLARVFRDRRSAIGTCERWPRSLLYRNFFPKREMSGRNGR